MPRILYSLFFYLLIPFVCLRLFWRGGRVSGYRSRWGERFGFVPAIPEAQPVIWVHSVSVGETIAAAPLIKNLQQRYPEHLLVVTTMTPTGSERVTALLGDTVYHVYAPYDIPGAVNRFLVRTHPELLVVMETELWPNIIRQCYRGGVPVVIANARLSAKSAGGYRRLLPLVRPMLSELDLVAAQSADDGKHFLELGLAADQLAVTGNIKFDLEITEDQRTQAAVLRSSWQGQDGRPVWLVASTHRGEDEIVLEAFSTLKERLPKLLLVLVPRHPDRFDEVADLCRVRGWTLARRGQGQAPGPATDILLGDTMGELSLFFGACDVAFVGGSLVPVGGHNLMEPAAWSVPVVTGPHLFNFSEASRLLDEAGGLVVVEDEQALAREVADLFEDASRAGKLGAAAYGVVEANRGAMNHLLALIADRLR